tara:strand:- start:2977 stop:3921 length:945 start_codon:yes stop_codon:yes gene_type:complete
MSNTLITGASGFVGANLARDLINTKNQIHILVRNESDLWRLNDIIPKCNVHFVDLLNPIEIKNVIGEVKPNIIFHCATFGVYPNQKNEDKISQTNVIGTKNLLLAQEKNTNLEKLVNLGSVFEYGSKTHSIDENDPTEGFDNYSKSKILQSELIQDFHHKHNLPTVTCRIFSPYGKFEASNRLISNTLISIIKHKPIEIISRNAIRDFIFIDDVIDALKKLSLEPDIDGEIFNVGSGYPTSVEDMVNLICKTTKTDPQIIWHDENDREYDKSGAKGYANISKIMKLDWKPKTTLENGLLQTYHWFKNNIENYPN